MFIVSISKNIRFRLASLKQYVNSHYVIGTSLQIRALSGVAGILPACPVFFEECYL